MTSVVVVGGGAAGLSAAVHAVQLGLDVTVVERAHPGSGSTGASAGVFTTAYHDPLDVRLRVLSAQLVSDWLGESRVPFVVTGYLRLGHTDGEREYLTRSLAEMHRQGVGDARLLNADGVAALVPQIAVHRGISGLWSPSDGYLDGHVLCTFWAEWLKQNGASVVQGTVVAADRDRQHSLRLADGRDLVADVVINAAGSHAQSLGEVLGHAMPLTVERHQLLFLRYRHTLPHPMPMVMDYLPGSGRLGAYFRQEGEDLLLAGMHSTDGGHELVHDPDAFDRQNDPEFVEAVGAALAELAPELADAGVVPGWAGLYPYSLDGRPIVGPYRRDPSVIACGGGGGVGVNLSPAMGLLAAQYAAGASTLVVDDAALLLPDRFT